MARHRRTPGEDTVNRLLGRAGVEDEELSREDLRRVSVPGQGEAFTGPVATAALRAMGAEAMTLDQSIIVSEDFDPTKARDAALFAHEQYHVEEGKGTALGHAIHDGEEAAARAVEAMVFHRMSGGYDPGYMPGGGAGSTEGGGTPDGEGRGGTTFNQSSDTKPHTVETDPDARRGYLALLNQGFSHQDVVDKLAKDALSTLDEAKEVSNQRAGDLKGSI